MHEQPPGGLTVICTIRATDQLFELPPEWKPCLEIIFFAGRLVQRPTNNGYQPIRKPQALVEFLAGIDHIIKHGPARFGRGDAKLLDFLELMHTEDTPHVSACRAGFLAEAGRISCVPDGQRSAGVVEPLARMERRDGLFRCGDEVLFIIVGYHLLSDGQNLRTRRGAKRQ
jgi:hypothetical protein